MSMSLTDARALAATGVVSPRAMRILDAVNSKGAYVSVTMRTPIVTNGATKKAGIVIEKIKTVNAKTGMEYRNLKQNEGAITGPLPHNQEWVIYPWIARSENGETEYARIYIDFDNATIRNTYLVDGVIVGQGKDGIEAIKQYLTPSTLIKMTTKPKDPVATLGYKVQNILEVNGITI